MPEKLDIIELIKMRNWTDALIKLQDKIVELENRIEELENK